MDVGHDEYWSQSQYRQRKGCGRRGCRSRLPERQSNLLGYRACTEFRRQPYGQPNGRGIQGHLERDATRPERDGKRRSGSVSRPCLRTRNSGKFAFRNDLHGGRYRLARQHHHPRQHVATALLGKHQHCQRQRRNADSSARLRVGQRPRQWLPASRTDRSVVDDEERQHAAPGQRGDNRSRHGNAQPYALPRHDERSAGLWRRHGHVVVGIVEPIRPLSWPHGAGQHGRAAVDGQPVRRHGSDSRETLQASLVLAQASSDHTAPTAAITSPIGGTSVNQGQNVTITGTASDVGGRVAGIEVSTDGGTTWHPATGTTKLELHVDGFGPRHASYRGARE